MKGCYLMTIVCAGVLGLAITACGGQHEKARQGAHGTSKSGAAASAVESAEVSGKASAVEPAEVSTEASSEEKAKAGHSGSGKTNDDLMEINVWGDSMAEGYFWGDDVSYPSVLEELTGIPTNNFGIRSEDSVEIMTRSLEYGDQSGDVMIIQMGDNGGWKDMNELIEQHREMLREGGTDKYIVVSSTDDPNDFEQIWGYATEPVGMADTWYEAALREAFGEHLFVARKYLVQKGLSVTGLAETAEDRERAAMGLISLQFREPALDNTHLNAAGYTAMAHGIYELGQKLGYWK